MECSGPDLQYHQELYNRCPEESLGTSEPQHSILHSFPQGTVSQCMCSDVKVEQCDFHSDVCCSSALKKVYFRNVQLFLQEVESQLK